MSDPVRSAVGRYIDPRNAADVAHAIEVWMLSEFGRQASGGCGKDGGELDYDLDDETVTVVVAAGGRLFGYKRHMEGDKRFELVDEDELKILEAHRELRYLEAASKRERTEAIRREERTIQQAPGSKAKRRRRPVGEGSKVVAD